MVHERARYPSHPNVDESLFGTRRSTVNPSSRTSGSRSTRKSIASAARIISKQDIQRIKVRTI